MRPWEHKIAGVALIAAGGYQFTRSKAICLGYCRAPVHFIMAHWRDGLPGAVLMGTHHGLYCVGCCWGLMLAFIALGMTNLAWRAWFALLILVEKVVPFGNRFALLVGAGLLFAGAGVMVGVSL